MIKNVILSLIVFLFIDKNFLGIEKGKKAIILSSDAQWVTLNKIKFY